MILCFIFNYKEKEKQTIFVSYGKFKVKKVFRWYTMTLSVYFQVSTMFQFFSSISLYYEQYFKPTISKEI